MEKNDNEGWSKVTKKTRNKIPLPKNTCYKLHENISGELIASDRPIDTRTNDSSRRKKIQKNYKRNQRRSRIRAEKQSKKKYYEMLQLTESNVQNSFQYDALTLHQC